MLKPLVNILEKMHFEISQDYVSGYYKFLDDHYPGLFDYCSKMLEDSLVKNQANSELYIRATERYKRDLHAHLDEFKQYVYKNNTKLYLEMFNHKFSKDFLSVEERIHGDSSGTPPIDKPSESFFD